MRASERSRRRQLLKPRVERAQRGRRALNGGGRVRAAGAAESRYDSRECTSVTGARASGIVGMLGPEILVDVPAALCKRWARRGSTQERAPPAG